MFLPLIMAFAHGLQNTVAQSLDDKKSTSDYFSLSLSLNLGICSWTSMKQNIVAQSLDDKKITSDNWLCVFFSSLWHLLKEKIATNCIDKATSQAVWLRKIFKDQWEKRLVAS